MSSVVVILFLLVSLYDVYYGNYRSANAMTTFAFIIQALEFYSYRKLNKES